MQLKIYSLTGAIFEGETNSITLPGSDGEITVLKGHIPLITVLKKGEIRFSDQKISIEKGFAEIDGSKVVVLAN